MIIDDNTYVFEGDEKSDELVNLFPKVSMKILINDVNYEELNKKYQYVGNSLYSKYKKMIRVGNEIEISFPTYISNKSGYGEGIKVFSVNISDGETTISIKVSKLASFYSIIKSFTILNN